MKRNVWIWNHYATNMFFDKAGRHYWFAENLLKSGYQPSIFCASTNHFSDQHIDTEGNKYITKIEDGIPFVFINVPEYKGNGKKRIMNMASFYKNIKKVSDNYAEENGKPDVIIASSVHPLTLVAGITVAKRFGVPCICEVRDLWPESLVAYNVIKRNSLITKLLYQGEKWIYKKASSVIMTWEGGKQYIKDQGWEDTIDLEKIHHISNGVNLDYFDINEKVNTANDKDLDDLKYKNIVYAGSIRKVNNLGILLEAAQIIQKSNRDDIRFLIYGSGDEVEQLVNKCKNDKINNVIFKGRVSKSQIPSILKKAHINVLHNTSTSLDKYGQSQNKLFEYLAAGKCIVQTYTTGFNIFNKYECGISTETQSPKEIANIILDLCADESKVKKMGENARVAANYFDYKKLSNDLIEIIESNLNRGGNK